jgi:hypothetical protein
MRRLGQGFGISQATAYRYKDEAVEVLAARVPTLREALDVAAEQGLAYLNPQRAHAVSALPGRTRLRADVPAVARHPARQPQPDYHRRHRQIRTRPHAIRAQMIS